MPSIAEATKAFLPTIPARPEFGLRATSELIDGGVWTQRIDRRETPEAFNEQPPFAPRRSVTVIDTQETSERYPGLSLGQMTLWVRWNDLPAEEAAADELIRAIMTGIDQQVIGTGSECGMVEVVDRFTQPDPWIEGGRMCYVRVRVAGLMTF